MIASGGWAPFALLAVIAFAIVLAGAVAVENQESADLSFWEGVRWSLANVLNPGAFVGDLDSAWPILTIAVLASLSGMFLFGTLISFIATSVQLRIDQFESGPVVEEGHTLILGWSHKTPLIVRGLLRLGSDETIVILARQSVQDMRATLRSEGLVRETRRLVVRSGDPSNRYELEQVSSTKADVVIVASPEDSHGLDVGADIAVVENLMVLASKLDNDERTNRKGHSGVNLVGEIAAKSNVEIADIASERRAWLICTTETVGRLTAQILRQPGLASVVAKLFEAPGGSIRVLDTGRFSGMQMHQLTGRLWRASPIGVTWQTTSGDKTRTAAALNLEPSYEVDDDEQLVLVTTRSENQLEKAPPALRESPQADASEAPARILILGRNDMRSEVLSQLDKQVSQGLKISLIDGHAGRPTEVDDSLPHGWVDLSHSTGSIIDRATLLAADPASYDCILVLSDEQRAATDPDAFTIMTLLLLDDIRRASVQDRWPRVIAELYDNRTVTMLPPHLADTMIVNPQIVSTMLAQIARLPILAPVYRELFSADGIEIVLRPVTGYAELGEPCVFSDLIDAAHRKLETVIGLRFFGPDGAEVTIAPDPTSEWTLTERDRVIVLAQKVYT